MKTTLYFAFCALPFVGLFLIYGFEKIRLKIFEARGDAMAAKVWREIEKNGPGTTYHTLEGWENE
jgi:hypothetical protein